jgi:rRNA maturation endonuclease Nob1
MWCQMSLGTEVDRAISSRGRGRSQLRIYECTECGRAFARDHDQCPACSGDVKAVILQ